MKPELLNVEERYYLKLVIEPFKEKVKRIGFSKEDKHLEIDIIYSYYANGEECINSVRIPVFSKKYKFKGIPIEGDVWESYTLEELGI